MFSQYSLQNRKMQTNQFILKNHQKPIVKTRLNFNKETRTQPLFYEYNKSVTILVSTSSLISVKNSYNPNIEWRGAKLSTFSMFVSSPTDRKSSTASNGKEC